MDENTPEQPEGDDESHEHEHAHEHTHEWPRKQIYFVTIEWLDDPHMPESPERLARAIRHALEHAHAMPAGTPPARFAVRVKADDVAVELEGKVEPHHHHH